MSFVLSGKRKKKKKEEYKTIENTTKVGTT